MADVWESAKSRGSQTGRDSTTRNLKFWVRGAVDEVDAEIQLINSGQMPAAYYGLPLQEIDVDEVLAGNLYECAVTYSNPKKNRDVGLVAIDFDTTGGRTKITNSRETVQSKAASGTAPDFKGAINVSEKKVEGVDIVIPALKFSLTGVLDFEDVTVAYVKMLAAATGRTNGSPFNDYDAGELLFIGASGSTRKNSDQQPGVEIKWSFEASQNVQDLQIGDITGIDKAGHDYLWVLHQPENDQVAKFTVRRPKAAYVERVYDSTDFDSFGIPTE